MLRLLDDQVVDEDGALITQVVKDSGMIICCPNEERGARQHLVVLPAFGARTYEFFIARNRGRLAHRVSPLGSSGVRGEDLGT